MIVVLYWAELEPSLILTPYSRSSEDPLGKIPHGQPPVYVDESSVEAQTRIEAARVYKNNLWLDPVRVKAKTFETTKAAAKWVVHNLIGEKRLSPLTKKVPTR